MRLTLLAAMALAGCSSTSSEPGKDATVCNPSTGPSTPLAGIFKAHYVEQSGNCGAIADQLVDFSGADSGCTSVRSSDSTLCHLEATTSCSEGTTIEVLDVSGDGLQVTGQVEISSSIPYCSSTYSVTETKQ